MSIRSSLARGAFTLIEMMIAMVITLMMVFAMVEAFKWIGDATTDGRAQIEMSGQIRAARYRLELDLNGVTVPLKPWIDADSFPGYFELVEGVGSDANPTQFLKPILANGNSNASYINFNFADPNNTLSTAYRTIFGDVDDVLMFTARNDNEPFRGRLVQMVDDDNNAMTPMVPQQIIIESNLAEIIWWAELNDTNDNGAGNAPGNNQWDPGETFTIKRRVLLIRPDLNTNGVFTTLNQGGNPVNQFLDNQGNATTSIDQALRFNDISMRANSSNNHIANSLGDLSLRHNRVAHEASINSTTGLSTNGLSPLDISRLPTYPAPPNAGSDYFGEDVILTGVTAFDFRVWDPDAPVVSDGGGLNESLVPGDPGFNARYVNNMGAVITANVVGQGAYIDLGTLGTAQSTSVAKFASLMNDQLVSSTVAAQRLLPLSPFVYDPWPMVYEKDGLNQDQVRDNANGQGNNLADEGTNGLDEDTANGPDDLAEKETSPPYPYPLKGLRVTIRMYEPDTRQVKQTSHEMSFE